MIKFDRIQQHGLRTIVQKLWTFIKESSVVLVAFDRKKLAGAELIAAAKIFTESADEEPWLSSRFFQHPSQHRRRGGFAVCPRHHEGAFSCQKKFPERLRERHVRNSRLQQGGCFRIRP